MATEEEVKKLLDRVEKAAKGKEIDLSTDEGLCAAIMNLIVTEEHLFFTAERTGRDVYIDLLEEVRAMRKDLMREMIKDVEGETWCASKHLMAASIRLMETGTKQLHKGNKEKAKELFQKSYQLYSLLWAINLNIVSPKEAEDHGTAVCSVCGIDDPAEAAPEEEDPYKRKMLIDEEEKPSIKEKGVASEKKEAPAGKKDFFSKISDVVNRVVNCCKD
jgi:hypothetical protein